jgi:hypothetical protein
MGDGLGSWFWALADHAVKQSEKQNRIETTKRGKVFIEDYLRVLSTSDSMKPYLFLSIVPNRRAKASFIGRIISSSIYLAIVNFQLDSEKLGTNGQDRASVRSTPGALC